MLTDPCDEISISQPTVTSLPNLASMTDPRLEELSPRTLFGGLLIGEKISEIAATDISSTSRPDISINASESTSEPAAQATENPLLTTITTLHDISETVEPCNPSQDTPAAETRLDNDVIHNMSMTLANEQRLVQAQPNHANSAVDLDESIPILDNTQEYSVKEEPYGILFEEPTQTVTTMEETEYMDTEIAEIFESSTQSVEEVTIYEVVTEYRPRPDVGQLLQQYPHIFIQLCDREVIDAESGE